MKNTSLTILLAAAMSFSAWSSANGAEQNNNRNEQRVPREQRAPRNQAPGANRIDPESRIKTMTEKLSLTGDQQAKVKAAYQEELKALQELRKDSDFASLTGPEKREKLTAVRQKTNEKIASFLNDEQKKKFKELQAEQSRPRGQGQGARPGQGQGRPRRQQPSNN